MQHDDTRRRRLPICKNPTAHAYDVGFKGCGVLMAVPAAIVILSICIAYPPAALIGLIGLIALIYYLWRKESEADRLMLQSSGNPVPALHHTHVKRTIKPPFRAAIPTELCHLAFPVQAQSHMIVAIGIDRLVIKSCSACDKARPKTPPLSEDCSGELAERGVDFNQPRLYVIDGSKAIRRAISTTCR